MTVDLNVKSSDESDESDKKKKNQPQLIILVIFKKNMTKNTEMQNFDLGQTGLIN